MLCRRERGIRFYIKVSRSQARLELCGEEQRKLGDCIPMPRPQAVESGPLWGLLLSCLIHSIPQNPLSSFMEWGEKTTEKVVRIQSTHNAPKGRENVEQTGAN